MRESCYGVTGNSRIQRSITLQYDNYLVQNNASVDLLIQDNGCTLVKLCREHVALDFLIITMHSDQLGGVASKKLYCVQVSQQIYQDLLPYKRFSAVTNPSAVLCDVAPLNYYCSKLGVQEDNAVYVYASGSVPSDRRFSR